MASQPSNPRGALKLPTLNTLKPLPPAQPQLTSTLPNLALFLTNIRLLNLDLRDDWPDITAVTFSTKDAQQNQKKRIQCVEWALYHLFAYWDPEETRNKLQPFFPPLEPLQSINLRGALFRCLDQAKKKGVLGRDTVLRKTMLDECKGERLEEVLAVFSTAVVKKIVQRESNYYGQPIAMQLALENFSYTGERTVLAALNLAHRGVMSKELRQKLEANAKFEDFSELLDLKGRQIVRRQEQLKESISARVEPDAINITAEESERLSAKVQKNWSGNNEWLQTILHGDGRFEKDGILAQPFDEVWQQVVSSGVTEVDDGKKKSLLHHLESRVKQQNHRLAKWQSFQRSFAEATDVGKTPSRISAQHHGKKGIDLKFGGHETLQIRQKATRTTGTDTPKFVLSEEYSLLAAKIDWDLKQVGRKDGGRSKHQSPHKPINPPSADELDDIKSIYKSPVSIPTPPRATTEDEDEGWSSTDSDRQTEAEVEAPKFIGSTPGTQSRTRSSEFTAQTSSSGSGGRRDSSEVSISVEPRQEAKRSSIISMPPPPKPVSAKSNPSSPNRSLPPQRYMDADSDTMADEILSSMAAASPSPTKLKRHTLSLAERTRMSMVRSSRSDFDDLPDLSPTKRNSLLSASKPTIKISNDGDPHADLITRTRQSMAGFAAAQKKADVDRRRSIRAAAKKARESIHFPPLFLETPEDEEGSEGWEKVDRAGLIEGNVDADYESVFKSRPKIALSPAVSPAPSPSPTWDQEEEELEGFEEESSPLRRLGR